MHTNYIMSIPHKPLHVGDLDDDLLSLVVKWYNDDDLREDNYIEKAKKINEYMKMRRNDKDFVEPTRRLLQAISTVDVNETKNDD